MEVQNVHTLTLLGFVEEKCLSDDGANWDESSKSASVGFS